MAAVHEAIAQRIPDRECIVWRDRRLSWQQVQERTRRLAHFLKSRGLGRVRERGELQAWESGQDHVALYMQNCNEYLEGMLGAYKARTVPFNVNYRYVREELSYLLKDAGTRAIVYHARFAPALATVLPELDEAPLLIQVADESDTPLLAGAVEYEAALRDAKPSAPEGLSPDDLYILYTGGTTGMPKGVMWRQADVFVSALGGRTRDGEQFESPQAVAEAAAARSQERVLTAPPLMHGAAHWVAFHAFHAGRTVVMQTNSERFDPHDVLTTITREKVGSLLIVGDAFARPLLDQLQAQDYDLSPLKHIVSSGAGFHADLKEGFLRELAGVTIVDALGSSETGPQGQNVSKGRGAFSGRFTPTQNARVLSEDLSRVLPPGHSGLGWFAQRGRVPLGYLNDPDKTRSTFPVVQGTRFAAPGDRARHLPGGEIELHGRDSVTINSGGEKIFAEEVEGALKAHPGVYDAVVCGRPSERWGQEVCAIVRPRDGVRLNPSELIASCAEHLARYKLPKQIIFRDAIQRSPSGKADYRWARDQALNP